jgi:hypothetical protein
MDDFGGREKLLFTGKETSIYANHPAPQRSEGSLNRSGTFAAASLESKAETMQSFSIV